MPGLRMEFRHRTREDALEFAREGRTSAGGRVLWDDLPAGSWGYLIAHPVRWGRPNWTRVDLPASGETVYELDPPHGRTITGRVTAAETGAPGVGARVGMGWALPGAVRGRVDGHYRLPGWTGLGVDDLPVVADGYGRAARVVGDLTRIEFRLEKGLCVQGRVRGPDRRPAAGLMASAIGSRREPGGRQTIRTDHTRTEPEGTFRMGGLRRDLVHTLVVAGEGYARYPLDFDPGRAAPGS